jgi:ADP-heptose:LPS heptosyltransferase
MRTALVHLAAGVGNIVLATPLLLALEDLGISVDLLLDADYEGLAGLFEDWTAVRNIIPARADALPKMDYDHVIPAIPPFYWQRFRGQYAHERRTLPRPPDRLFYTNEQLYYLQFAHQLGFPKDREIFPYLPIAPAAEDAESMAGADTVVLAPGCKTGEMAYKRWPGFVELANRLADGNASVDVAVVGTADDLGTPSGDALRFPPHARSYIGRLSLRATAELMAGAGVVIGNDSGLSHLAAATGVPTLMIFGPTPHVELGRMPPHVQILRAGLPCEPCWFGDRFGACAGRVTCLQEVTVDRVLERIQSLGLAS